jgi:hypothetical protein
MRTTIKFAFAAALPFLALTSMASAQSAMTDDQIRAELMKSSREAVYKTGNTCACPDDKRKNGKRCNAKAAYSRSQATSVFCSPGDVTARDIERYKAAKK